MQPIKVDLVIMHEGREHRVLYHQKEGDLLIKNVTPEMVRWCLRGLLDRGDRGEADYDPAQIPPVKMYEPEVPPVVEEASVPKPKKEVKPEKAKSPPTPSPAPVVLTTTATEAPVPPSTTTAPVPAPVETAPQPTPQPPAAQVSGPLGLVPDGVVQESTVRGLIQGLLQTGIPTASIEDACVALGERAVALRPSWRNGEQKVRDRIKRALISLQEDQGTAPGAPA